MKYDMQAELLRHELRMAWIKARDPGPIDYKLLAWGHILVLIGFVVAVIVWKEVLTHGR